MRKMRSAAPRTPPTTPPTMVPVGVDPSSPSEPLEPPAEEVLVEVAELVVWVEVEDDVMEDVVSDEMLAASIEDSRRPEWCVRSLNTCQGRSSSTREQVKARVDTHWSLGRPSVRWCRWQLEAMGAR